MRSQTRIILAVTFLALSAAILVSCEDSGVTAPTDGQILVSANPGTIVIDRQLGEDSGQSTITAQVFDASGFALEDVLVTFSASGGRMTSSSNGCSAGTCSISGGGCTIDSDCPAVPPTPIETDANGLALDILTLELADPVSVEVTVRSSTLSQSVQITKTISSGNVQPIAQAEAFPANLQQAGQPITFSGAGSVDPDGDDITCYQWTIDAQNAADDEVSQGSANSLISRTYMQEQRLSVILRVSDDPTVPCSPSPPADQSFFSPDADFVDYVVCDNDPPTASAGPDQTVALAGGASISAQMDGSGSSDVNSVIAEYRWTCGNGQTVFGVDASCVYTSAGVFTAVLTVTDRGNPLADCADTATDTAVITVNP